MTNTIGRKEEQAILEKAYQSDKAEFIVIYGRRRVGKTFLAREFYLKKDCVFVHVTGVYKGRLKTQLQNFTTALSEAFLGGVALQPPTSWEEALSQLQQQISQAVKKQIVIFFDELPWLATRKSRLLESIDYYWNHHWSQMRNVTFVACGSSASWLIKKIIYSKHGLHNRVTQEIALMPFSLSETKDYLKAQKVRLNDQNILALYMVLGGIPYYLNYVKPGMTAEQNIQQIIFDVRAPLRDEFHKLFSSLFKNADAYVELIHLIAGRREGLRRAEIEKKARLTSGGSQLTGRLRDLASAGFIQSHVAWGRAKGEYHKLIDEFSLFYLKWVYPVKRQRFTQNYWVSCAQTPAYYAWSGYAFESVCFKHIDQIVDALDIKAAGVISAWRFIPRKHDEDGAQIDLLIDRNDNAITVCEIKHTDEPFVLGKQETQALIKKLQIFKSKTRTRKQLFVALISVNGIKSSYYAEEFVDIVITLKDLMH